MQGVLFALFHQSRKHYLSLTENLDFTPASGPIEAGQFSKIQARSRPEKPEHD